MKIFEFITLMFLGVYVNAVFGYQWPDHNWNIYFRTINVNLVDDTKDEMVVKSIDAGLFNKDINEETYCRYTYSQPSKKHYMLCYATIKNYSKRNTAKKYYFYMDFGTNQKPSCNEGYDITSKSQMYFDLINLSESGGKPENTKYLGELRFDKFANGKTLPYEGGVKRKAFRLINDYCYYILTFDKVEILDKDPNY